MARRRATARGWYSHALRDIEEKTKRTVDIETDEDAAIHKSNPQAQSPLFTVLPRELRDLVWKFALAPYQDPAGAFKPEKYYYRPGHTAELKTETTMLRTCRRVWLEANALPMSLAEHSYYFYRKAPDAREVNWTSQLTQHNRQNFGHMHMFAQMFEIERLRSEPDSLRQFFHRAPFTPGDFQPRKFHLTIRHTDWWSWESEAPLRLRDKWVQALLDGPDLRSTETLKLELETLDYKVDQLLPIVERLKALVSEAKPTHIVNGKEAKTQFVLQDAVETYNWTGPTNIDNVNYTPYANKTSLNYHVIVLTWKLRFLEYPSAFIPKARKAPRLPSTLPLNAFGRSARVEGNGRYPTIYTAALPHEPGTPRLSWRKRKRGSGDSPAGEMLLKRLRDAEAGVREGSRALEVWCEERRRLEYSDSVAESCAEGYRERWGREGSLLKFREELVGEGERWWGKGPWVTI